MTAIDTPRPADRLLRRGWRSWLVLYAAWSLPALLTAVSAVAIQRAADQPAPLVRSLVQQLWFYWVLASICPAIYRLNGRVRFRHGQWLTALAAHAAACGVVVAGLMVVAAVLDVLMGVQPLSIPAAIATEFTTPRGQFRGMVDVFYYVVVAGAMELIRVDRRRREHEQRAAELSLRTSRLEAQVAQARLAALEMQLNPHFLFNALHGIASLVEQRRHDDAYRAIGLLGDLLRATLGNGERAAVPLERELALVETYLEIERLRFSDRLRVRVRVDDDCRRAAVPALILQPLVENAVRHALAPHPGPCTIGIAVRRAGRDVCLEVTDDGPGLPRAGSPGRGGGVGLANVRERLAALYGNAAALRVETVRPRGVAARIVLPFVEAERTGEAA